MGEHSRILYSVGTQDIKEMDRKVVDGHLLNNSFLVGSCITLADITLVCSLDLAYRMVREMVSCCRQPLVTHS